MFFVGHGYRFRASKKKPAAEAGTFEVVSGYKLPSGAKAHNKRKASIAALKRCATQNAARWVVQNAARWVVQNAARGLPLPSSARLHQVRLVLSNVIMRPSQSSSQLGNGRRGDVRKAAISSRTRV